ncbi:PEP-CTERM sorting domain-containing protein [Bradyrhizobium japonicum]|uniref:PEPxxWA-CTERM sorting domain-containing protein n=1 Tax=Bradyrhizobium japonicum TaxID=375 RepID=UPI001BAE5046|nr:PEPxxWA-CTERM sorting domain-containing protein [Bradyrhizobium japonicum]MBR0995223.1 PEP-CTERM sorting domain-containing protein [Bradyrhizobium japonicum]
MFPRNDASGSYGFTTTGDGQAGSFQSYLGIDGPGVAVYRTTDVETPSLGTLNSRYLFQPNQLYHVTIIAEGPAGVGNDPGTASFWAQVDPVFKIDPSFADAASYSFIMSDSIGNTISAVPEPSTWAMMLLGFVGIGATTFQRRKSTAVPA